MLNRVTVNTGSYLKLTGKNAFLTAFGVKIVWDNEWILGCESGIPPYFVGADDIITNLAKEREPGIEIIKHTPYSLIVTSSKYILTKLTSI